jgi:hypothetical protein
MTKITLLLAFLSLSFLYSSAQSPNLDSANQASKVSVDSSKLLMLQHKLADKMAEKQAAELEAQQKASDNASAAGDLSSDPDSKKLARVANRDANHAQNAAKRARSAGDEVNYLNKEIRKQQHLLAKDQLKMSRYMTASGNIAGTVVPASAAPDSTQKN